MPTPLDTEFHRERTYFPQLALVQLAWRGGIALVDPLAIDISPLARVLQGPGLAVVHAAEQDLEVLEHACGTVPARLFDTQVAAGFLGQVSPSLVNLVERVLGVRLLKGDQLTDWTRRPLSAGQLAYAAGDVAYLLELRERIGERLEEKGRMQWANEEFAILLSRDRSSTEPEQAWWRLPRSRQLRGPRGVAQCVAAWRERRAQRMDLPVRFVLPDLAVLSISQHPTRTPRISGGRGAWTGATSAAAPPRSSWTRLPGASSFPSPSCGFLPPMSWTSPTGPSRRSRPPMWPSVRATWSWTRPFSPRGPIWSTSCRIPRTAGSQAAGATTSSEKGSGVWPRVRLHCRSTGAARSCWSNAPSSLSITDQETAVAPGSAAGVGRRSIRRVKIPSSSEASASPSIAKS